MLAISKIDVIKSFNVSSSWIAYQLARANGKACKAIAGYYNPLRSEYPGNVRIWHGDYLPLAAFLKAFPASGRLFCSVDQIEELEEIYGKRAVFWPVPCDASEFEPATRRPRWGKIVSVGRLEGMKEYNLYMIGVVKELIARGHNVSWQVYGEGKYDNEMRQSIKAHGLEGKISMEGTVPYRLLWRVLEDAYVFVGMGTSAVEAAMFKVPNVIAIPYDFKGVTYGSSYSLPWGSIGHSRRSPPCKRVVDEIERVLCLNRSQYEAEGELVAKHAEAHEIDSAMKMFMVRIERAEPIIPIAHRFANYPLGILRQVIKRIKISTS
jgi:hypothetical protein